MNKGTTLEYAYLFSIVTEDDVASTVFLSKTSVLKHISSRFPDYEKIAQDTKEDVQYWRGPSGHGILVEKLPIQETEVD